MKSSTTSDKGLTVRLILPYRVELLSEHAKWVHNTFDNVEIEDNSDDFTTTAIAFADDMYHRFKALPHGYDGRIGKLWANSDEYMIIGNRGYNVTKHTTGQDKP